MFFPGYPGAYRRGTFKQSYHVYPVSFIDKPLLENGDKVIMPPSALDRLASLRIDYPMLFEVHNPAVGRTSHCGVLEFVADEGLIYMPYWMMQNLLLQEGDLLELQSATLPKGSYVKLQPHTSDFLDISNPKAVLETTLRNFSCLTVGDNIMVAYNNKKYYIDIIEAKPARAITIIETDCEVDFAPPLDYKEPSRPTPDPKAEAAVANGKAAAGAGGAGAAKEEDVKPEEPKFQAFLGTGRRLDGKPSEPGATSSGPAASATSKEAGTSAPASGVASAPSAAGKAAPAPQRAAGKLVFGKEPEPAAAPVTNGAKTVAKAEKGKEPAAEPEPKFQAFSGKKYSLRPET